MIDRDLLDALVGGRSPSRESSHDRNSRSPLRLLSSLDATFTSSRDATARDPLRRRGRLERRDSDESTEMYNSSESRSLSIASSNVSAYSAASSFAPSRDGSAPRSCNSSLSRTRQSESAAAGSLSRDVYHASFISSSAPAGPPTESAGMEFKPHEDATASPSSPLPFAYASTPLSPILSPRAARTERAPPGGDGQKDWFTQPVLAGGYSDLFDNYQEHKLRKSTVEEEGGPDVAAGEVAVVTDMRRSVQRNGSHESGVKHQEHNLQEEYVSRLAVELKNSTALPESSTSQMSTSDVRVLETSIVNEGASMRDQLPLEDPVMQSYIMRAAVVSATDSPYVTRTGGFRFSNRPQSTFAQDFYRNVGDIGSHDNDDAVGGGAGIYREISESQGITLKEPYRESSGTMKERSHTTERKRGASAPPKTLENLAVVSSSSSSSFSSTSSSSSLLIDRKNGSLEGCDNNINIDHSNDHRVCSSPSRGISELSLRSSSESQSVWSEEADGRKHYRNEAGSDVGTPQPQRKYNTTIQSSVLGSAHLTESAGQARKQNNRAQQASSDGSIYYTRHRQWNAEDARLPRPSSSYISSPSNSKIGLRRQMQSAEAPVLKGGSSSVEGVQTSCETWTQVEAATLTARQEPIQKSQSLTRVGRADAQSTVQGPRQSRYGPEAVTRSINAGTGSSQTPEPASPSSLLFQV